MIFAAMSEAAEAGELLLAQDGLCRFHRRRDGVVVIREILVLPFRRRTGLGRQLVEAVRFRNPGRTLRARCPANSRANGFWEHLGFRFVGETEDIKTWELPPSSTAPTVTPTLPPPP